MDRKIILASNSPRRSEILNQYVDFSIKSENVIETYDETFKPHVNSMSIAFEKAVAVANKNTSCIVIGADTLVFMDKPMEKPKDREDAKQMLKALSNKTHKVITGCVIICVDENYKNTFYVSTDVKFKNLTDEMIENYLNTDEYIDKAGAYGIQGYGNLLVESIDGDFYNVVGFPISKISDVFLNDLGIDFLKR